jgi:hypothetical protein
MKRSQSLVFILCWVCLAALVLAGAVFAQDARPAPQEVALQPSITPLFQGGPPAQIIPFGYQQAQPGVPGAITATPLPGQFNSFAAPGATAATSAQPLSQSLPTAVIVATQIPGSIATLSITTVTTASTASDGGFLSTIFNQVLVPVINFVLNFVNNTVVSLWNTVGNQGGLVAQVLCCIGPGVLFAYWFLFRRSFGRRRR